MNIANKIPDGVRYGLYVATLVITPVVTTLFTFNIIPEWVNALWALEVVAVSTIAGLNVYRPIDTEQE